MGNEDKNELFLDMMIKFINHNVELCNIKSTNNILSLIDFIYNVKDNYMPMVKQIEEFSKQINKN